MSEFYETQPETLPATLPIGTKVKGHEIRATGIVELRRGSYWGKWGGRHEQHTTPSMIDWGTVRRNGEPSGSDKHASVIRMRSESKSNEEIAGELGLDIMQVMMLSVTPLPQTEAQET